MVEVEGLRCNPFASGDVRKSGKQTEGEMMTIWRVNGLKSEYNFRGKQTNKEVHGCQLVHTCTLCMDVFGGGLTGCRHGQHEAQAHAGGGSVERPPRQNLDARRDKDLEKSLVQYIR